MGRPLLKSRKFWCAAIGSAASAAASALGAPALVVKGILALFAAYIGAQAAEDAAAKHKPNSPHPDRE